MPWAFRRSRCWRSDLDWYREDKVQAVVAGDDEARDPRDDAELLRAHADGDRGAFAELTYRHRDRLWAVALRTIGDREEAADALQDALLRSEERRVGKECRSRWSPYH